MSFGRAVVSKLLPTTMKAALRRQLFRLLDGMESLIAAVRRQFGAPDADRRSALKIGSFGKFQVAYREKTADEAVLGHSFDHDIFFTGIPDYKPAETDVILDVGAHIGTFAILAASKVGGGAVYAIEACEDTFNYLRVNAALNRLQNLSTFHLALSDRRGTCRLYHDNGNWGHSMVSEISDRGEEVRCCTLEDFFEENQIERCSFIKFNCEGAEFPILLSSPSSVLRKVEKMLVLYHCDLWPKNTPEDLVSHLESSGFECRITNRAEKRGWIVARNSR